MRHQIIHSFLPSMSSEKITSEKGNRTPPAIQLAGAVLYRRHRHIRAVAEDNYRKSLRGGNCRSFLPVVRARSCSGYHRGDDGRSLVDRIVLRHGCPRRLLSDRGSQFTSQLFKEVSARLEIKKIFTSAYHLQTNGQVERMNRYIAAALSAYVNENQTDWDEYLETIALAYRTSMVDAIGNTPFYLVHGRDARLPTEISEDLDGSVHEDVYQYGVDLTKRIGEAFTLARESQEKSDAARKKLYDAKHQPIALDEGTLVLLHSPLHKQASRRNWLRNFKALIGSFLRNHPFYTKYGIYSQERSLAFIFSV